VSLDGGDEASYAWLRGATGYDAICHRTRSVLDQVASHNVAVVVSVMRPPGQLLALAPRILQLWNRPPVSHIKLFHPHNWASASLLPAPEGARAPCAQPWRNATVTSSGQILPCDIDLGRNLVMGSIEGATIEEIRNGPRFRELRRRHLRGNPKDPCRQCSFAVKTDQELLEI
jgi:radical SAM protein with 4Fe4S-binding SPASM domain